MNNTLSFSVPNFRLSGNSLKAIAIIFMILDHFVIGFLDHNTALAFILRIPGRLAAPIMCYFIAEGYHYTADFNKYLKRLLIMAIISHFPYVLYLDLPWWSTSIMWSLAMGLIALAAVKSNRLNLPGKIGAVIICCALAYTANWHYVAVLWVVAFGLFRGQFFKQAIAFSLIGLFGHIMPTLLKVSASHYYEIAIFLAIPLLAAYSGSRGQYSKAIQWAFYIAYPAHFIVLYLLKLML